MRLFRRRRDPERVDLDPDKSYKWQAADWLLLAAVTIITIGVASWLSR
jgi:hypothetical protein